MRCWDVDLSPEYWTTYKLYGANSRTLGLNAGKKVGTLAGSTSGKFIVAWDQPHGRLGYDIFFRPFNQNGFNTGPVQRLNTTTAGDQRGPLVAYLADGGFVAVWSSQTLSGAPGRILGQRYNADGARVGGEFQVCTACDGVGISGLRGGGFVIVWGASGQVFGQIFSLRGRPVGSRLTFASQTVCCVLGLKDADGFVVFWTQNQQAYGQRYSVLGKIVGNAFPIGGQGMPGLAALAGGGFVAVWQESDDVISSRTFSSLGQPTGNIVQVNDPNQSLTLSYFSLVAAPSSGGFVVVWGAFDQADFGTYVYGQRFSAP